MPRGKNCRETPFVPSLKGPNVSETSICSWFCLFAILGGFVRNFGSVFAIWLGGEGGGLRGAKIVNKTFVNKLAFPVKLLPLVVPGLSIPPKAPVERCHAKCKN